MHSKKIRGTGKKRKDGVTPRFSSYSQTLREIQSYVLDNFLVSFQTARALILSVDHPHIIYAYHHPLAGARERIGSGRCGQHCRGYAQQPDRIFTYRPSLTQARTFTIPLLADALSRSLTALSSKTGQQGVNDVWAMHIYAELLAMGKTNGRMVGKLVISVQYGMVSKEQQNTRVSLVCIHTHARNVYSFSLKV